MLSVLPVFGGDILQLIWGSESVTSRTERRIMIIHFLLPFILMLIIGTHLILLHIDQSSVYKNIPANTGNTTKLLPLSMHRDTIGGFALFVVFFTVLVLNAEWVSHPDNYIEAEPSITPKHIVPEWYFLPLYGLLRLLPDKVFGMIIMVLALLWFIILSIYT